MGSGSTRWARGVAVVALALAGALASLPPAVAVAAPAHFHMPVRCGETWRATTYSGHASNAIDLNWGTGSDNLGLPVVASAAGTAYRKSNPGGYGSYVDVDHGGGWVTRYAHLSAFSVPDGATVTSGQQIGKVGSTGSSTAPHLHYEQRLNGVRQPITFSGVAIRYAGHPGEMYTSQNCAGPSAALLDRVFPPLVGRLPTAAERATWDERIGAGTHTREDLVVELRATPDNLSNVDPAARLYRAYFLRTPDVAGLRYWIGERRAGVSISRISQAFAASGEFRTLYGALTDREFVERVYLNVLGRPGEPAGITYWTDQIAAGRTRGDVMKGFSESPEYRAAQRINTDTSVVYAALLDRMPTAQEIASFTQVDASTRVVAAFAFADPAYAP